MHRLVGITKNYLWGSHTLLAGLRNSAPTSEPEAEIWYGAHAAGPSLLDNGHTLLAHIQHDAAGVLGEAITTQYGPKLPFLLKLLAADEPLSIQAHPTKAQAEAGFARENAAGIAVDAPQRSFRDDAPKPELIVALSHFEALVGFRPVALTLEYLSSIGAAGLAELVSERGLIATVRWALDPSDDEREGVVAVRRELIDATRSTGERWSAEASLIQRISLLHPDDPGILVAALLNRVQLEPGQAAFLDAGTLHAYIGGLGVEVMGNSDNVLRGGLTEKHIDTDNLLMALRDESIDVDVLTPDTKGRYDTPAPEFRLSQLAARSQEVSGPAVVLATNGTTTVHTATGQLVLAPTEAAWLGAAELSTVTTDACCYVAEVGR